MPLMECLLQPLPLSSSREALGKESLSDGVDAEALAALLPLSPQAQELRRAAARVLGLLCKRCFRERNGLQSVASAAALQLQRHLLHPLSCLDTAAGAALGLVEIGSEAVRELLLPHARLLLHALERSQQLNEVELLAVGKDRSQKREHSPVPQNAFKQNAHQEAETQSRKTNNAGDASRRGEMRFRFFRQDNKSLRPATPRGCSANSTRFTCGRRSPRNSSALFS